MKNAGGDGSLVKARWQSPVYCGEFEIRRGGNTSGGSNPSRAAIDFENQMCHQFRMTDVFDQVEKEIEGHKPTPYLAIPFIVFFGFLAVQIGLLFLMIMLNMAEWLPSVTWEDQHYRGVEAISEVYQMLLTRTLLVLWPICSVLFIYGEAQDRKRHAA